MIRYLTASLFSLLLSQGVLAEQYVTILQGLDGTDEYGQQFTTQAETLVSAAGSVTAKERVRLLAGDEASRENVLAHFADLAKRLKPDDRLAVFLIGHGSFDGFEYKFNISGPDLTGADLADMLNALPAKSQVVVNMSSSSGVVQDLLKSDTRTVITATRNGEERLATRFGGYFTAALEDSAADTNKNNAVSLQEAFDYAQRQVKDYYETQGQLATEHPVMNGNAGQFVLARAGRATAPVADGELAELIRRREQLDISIEQLQLRKAELPADEYMNQLQTLMIDLSMVQDMIEKKEQGGE